MVVDCLLPARVQQMGQKFTYLAPRRAIKTTQSDCAIRGGEYTAYDRSNYATALKIWLPQAEAGDPVAQTYVGEIYEKGLGIQADYRLAAAWYRKAAAQGYSRAMINLGFLHESGLGVDQDIVVAMNWYRKASGLAEADLEYVSTIERAKRKAAVDETVRLRGQVGELQGRVAELQQELETRQSRLKSERDRAAMLRSQLQRARQKATASAAPGSVAETARLKQELAGANADKQKLSAALASQEARIQSLQSSLSSKEKEVSNARQALNESKAALTAASGRMQNAQGKSKVSAAEMARIKADQEQQSRKVAELESRLSRLSKEYDNEKTELSRQLEQSRQEQGRLQKRLSGAELAQQEAEELNRKLAGVQKQNSKLQQSLAASQSRETQLKTQLAKASDRTDSAQLEKDLRIAREESQALKQQADSARAEQLRLQQALMQAQLGEGDATEQVAILESRLAETESSIAEQEREVAKLKKAAAAPAAAPKEVAANKVIATVAAGPEIEIIDPPMSVTRSVPTLFAPPSSRMIEVIGKITPAEDLLTFKINGKKQALNENGLFQMKQSLGDKEMPVQMLAIDRKGQKTELKFLMVPSSKGAASPPPNKRGSNEKGKSVIDFGNYHALIIGNEDYQNLSDLSTPVNDAKTIDSVLRSKYGYKTTLLINATRYQILSALNKLRETLTENDNLLIYYAGHGELDSVNLRGFWLPVDAEPDNSANWISNVAITDTLNIMSAKHVLVVADSCYSGSLTRAAIARLRGGMSAERKNRWYKTMAKARTRTVLTSGGVQPVLDSGGGDHSIFAKAFISSLRGNGEILEGYQLYRSVLQKVKVDTKRLNVEQNPQYAPLKYAGHEAGEFFFLPKSLQSKRRGLNRVAMVE